MTKTRQFALKLALHFSLKLLKKQETMDKEGVSTILKMVDF